MDDREKFSGISLLEKDGFYSQVKIEGFTDSDYIYAK